jgi:hypothetical protein
VTGGHLFDLAARLAGNGLDPGLLCRGRRDARELADHREMERAAGERGLESGERLERSGDAQALLGLARREPGEPFGIFVDAPEPQCLPAISAQCVHERPDQGMLVLASSTTDGDHFLVCALPLERIHDS